MSKPWEIHHPADPEGDVDQTQESERLPLMQKGQVRRSDFFGFTAWLEDLEQTFGNNMLVLLFTIQHLVKGFLLEFMRKANPYIFKLYHVPAPQASVFTGVTSLPWAMKPMIGLISDVFPLWGYNKAPYMVITTVFGVCALSYSNYEIRYCCPSRSRRRL
jgi:hypothetical protein